MAAPSDTFHAVGRRGAFPEDRNARPGRYRSLRAHTGRMCRRRVAGQPSSQRRILRAARHQARSMPVVPSRRHRRDYPASAITTGRLASRRLSSSVQLRGQQWHAHSASRATIGPPGRTCATASLSPYPTPAPHSECRRRETHGRRGTVHAGFGRRHGLQMLRQVRPAAHAVDRDQKRNRFRDAGKGIARVGAAAGKPHGSRFRHVGMGIGR